MNIEKMVVTIPSMMSHVCLVPVIALLVVALLIFDFLVWTAKKKSISKEFVIGKSELMALFVVGEHERIAGLLARNALRYTNVQLVTHSPT